MAYSSGGTLLVGGSNTGKIYIWNALENGNVKFSKKLTASQAGDAVRQVFFKDKLIAGQTEREISLFDWSQVGTPKLAGLRIGQGNPKKFTAMAVSSNEKMLLVGYNDKLQALYAITAKGITASYTGQEEGITPPVGLAFIDPSHVVKVQGPTVAYFDVFRGEFKYTTGHHTRDGWSYLSLAVSAFRDNDKATIYAAIPEALKVKGDVEIDDAVDKVWLRDTDS